MQPILTRPCPPELNAQHMLHAGGELDAGALPAGERRLEGSDRALLAYGRRLQTAPDARMLPVGRGILAYGRRLMESGTTQDAHLQETGASSHCSVTCPQQRDMMPLTYSTRRAHW